MKKLASDLAIAQAAKLKPITELARKIGIKQNELELYGRYKAKVSPEILKRLADRPDGKYIDVTAITPTPLGEGKTVTTIGLSMGIKKIGKSVITAIRQPSLGPVFGIKGGGAGGGYSQVVPMEDFNLHLTGDVHAVGLAHNLLAAFLDNSVFKGNKLGIDPSTITWKRVVDINDRFLRKVIIGLGGRNDGIPRKSGFDITATSEVMAILALASNIFDLRKRLGRITVASTYDGKPVTADDLKVAGAMTVLMKDAIRPTLIQTLENTPCFVHAGPFANIAHGNSSIIADRIGIKLADYLVTESGFGADCGAEKFFNIKCRYSGLKPDCAVIVVSIRALKMHSGDFRIVAGKPLEAGLLKENVDAVERGCANLEKQIENLRFFGVPVVVAINKFRNDTKRELNAVHKRAINSGAEDAVVSEVWAKGGEGGKALARTVAKACNKKSNFRYLYSLSIPIKEKIEKIALDIYGARRVKYSALAERKIRLYTERGYDRLPICMAKTHLSLSHDPELKGRPVGFTLPIRDINASVGAGFLYPLCGEMRTMPGLPSVPIGTRIDIDKQGKTKGLF
jgi:formate--tetrahydrofolate ligase